MIVCEASLSYLMLPTYCFFSFSFAKENTMGDEKKGGKGAKGGKDKAPQKAPEKKS
jgi:hypothetical protein